jgi:phosphoribosylaminoimidazole carboxylase/phosphoribosylaminoimidazole-succinocarboxamide synthase
MDSKFAKGKQIAEGKTKIIYEVDNKTEGMSGLVIVCNKDNITKNDDASQTRELVGKSVYATTTTCAVFELLKQAGVPVAYVERISETEFVAKKCDMIKLEVIARRYVYGSFEKRFPNMTEQYRFHNLKFELFLKTTYGVVQNKDDYPINELPHDPLFVGEQKKRIDDPFIVVEDNKFKLFHPKIPMWEPAADLNITVDMDDVLPERAKLEEIEILTRKTFLILEGAFAQFGVRLIDFKIEFGITDDGELVISDVIDNDSWRIKDENWNDLSKQLFRDGASMDVIKDKFALVANLVQNFRIPKQAIVFWQGDFGGVVASTDLEAMSIYVESTNLSWHKSISKCIQKLEELLAKYPEGGIIIVADVWSNEVLSKRTSWPILQASPKNENGFPTGIYSDTQVLPIALGILGLKNPLAYALVQEHIEGFDN